ncbi:Phosphatidylinositol mannoside acyltransferase [Phycisphaerales bacterium]|nr:Phosphatidylinositol mannoside acyltransferase [Phycisphaerales bacterium]
MKRARDLAADFWLLSLFWCATAFPWVLKPLKRLALAIAWRSSRHLRCVTLANAARILGPDSTPAQRSRLGRAVVNNFFEHVKEFGIHRDAANILNSVDVSGAEHFESARAHARGAIIVTAHLGPFETAVASLRSRERHVHVVFRRDRYELFERLRSRQRRRLGVIEAPIDDGIAMWIGLRDALARNEVVLLQADRTPAGERGVAVPFLHGRVRIPTGPARLARLTGAPIVPVFAARAADRVRLFVEPPIPVGPEVSDGDICVQLGSLIAKYVARYPDQWLVLEKAWIEDQETRS